MAASLPYHGFPAILSASSGLFRLPNSYRHTRRFLPRPERHRLSLSLPVPVPDLIGVKDRHYLDRTGLQQQRSIADLMRYAALNQGADDLAGYDGFVPAEFLSSKAPLDPADPVAVGGRYSDEQLYALALYLYSLQPPPNPNRMDSVAVRGKRIFESQGCPRLSQVAALHE